MSAMLSEAVRVPVPDGLKTTVMVQLAPGASELAQVFVSLKSGCLTPVTLIFVRLRVDEPLFVSLTFCAGLATPTV